MIEANGLTKTYGDKRAVNDISFTVQAGTVTGFLGPNGAGKSTTMRMILGLDAPTAGAVRVNGKSYVDLQAPLHEVGALLEARAVHTGRSAMNHLRAMAATSGIGRRRVEEVIDLAGLRDVAGKRAGAFSLGMGQRLGIASALLGDPATLMLDEPVNGLDPDGIRWVRTLLRQLADEGRTVFLSSHLMSEMALTADHLIIIGRGRILRDVSIAQFLADAGGARVLVRTPDAAALRDLLLGRDVTVSSTEPGALEVRGLTNDEIGRRAHAAGLALYELTPIRPSLEDAYMEITRDAVEYHGATSTPATTSEDHDLTRSAA